MRLRVLHADDHPLARSSCRTILERAGFDIVGEAADGPEAVRLARMHQPDVVVVDVNMPGMDTLDTVRAIRCASPHTMIVCWTMFIEDHHVAAALRIGVRGYVAKTNAAHDLPDAIRTIVAGGVYVSSCVRGPAAASPHD
jgi:DNA-binding NarL/FixJ family response regulator